MAINFANVNISLSEFQRLSKGEFNAGEVRLKDEGRLRKMNNHIKTWWYNHNETISHAEVLAIKGAFVKALSQNGLDEDQINDVRRRIGLAPVSAGDRELRQRSIKPLMRTQIREILDQYAGLINDFNQQAAWDMENISYQNGYKHRAPGSKQDDTGGEVNVSYIPRQAIVGAIYIGTSFQIEPKRGADRLKAIQQKRENFWFNPDYKQ